MALSCNKAFLTDHLLKHSTILRYLHLTYYSIYQQYFQFSSYLLLLHNI